MNPSPGLLQSYLIHFFKETSFCPGGRENCRGRLRDNCRGRNRGNLRESGSRSSPPSPPRGSSRASSPLRSLRLRLWALRFEVASCSRDHPPTPRPAGGNKKTAGQEGARGLSLSLRSAHFRRALPEAISDRLLIKFSRLTWRTCSGRLPLVVLPVAPSPDASETGWNIALY